MTRRVPLLSGTRIVVANAADADTVIAPPPPVDAIGDVGASVRDALRFPLGGEPLEALVPRGQGRATIVVEQPVLPLPGAQRDPRQTAIAAAVDELERLGIPSGYQTLLVAGGLARRAGRRALEALVSREFARRFHGNVVVHDAEDPGLVPLAGFRVNRALVETDLVLTVTAAETVLHGGPAALLGAADARSLRFAGADSLLETAGSSGWDAALRLERALGAQVRLVGVSLVLNPPRLGGAFRGYPFEPAAVERVARSKLRHAFGVLPGWGRRQLLRSLPLELTATAAFAGAPSVAHAEALLRAIERRSATLASPVDVLCIGIPRATPHLPRERPNPLLAAALGLGLALRLWRDGFPVASGGTVVLLHRFHRNYPHPTQQPYRAFFAATRTGPNDAALAEAERAVAADERALGAYRSGRTCHPLLPFADWDGCRPALGRVGAVLVAGCRDATAARQLGFVPTHGLGPALELARGRAGRDPTIGFLLAPPYFPLRRDAAG